MKGSLSLFDIYFALNVFGLICLFVFLPPFFFETEGELSMVSLFCFWSFRSCLFLRDAFKLVLSRVQQSLPFLLGLFVFCF